MASIKKRKLANGETVYDVRYRDPSGKARCETKRTHKAATTRKRDVETAMDQGT